MTCADPDKRLTAAEAHQLFQNDLASFSEADMSRRLWRPDVPPKIRQKYEFRKSKGSLSAKLLRLFRLRNLTILKFID
jgi:hypothetical protein